MAEGDYFSAAELERARDYRDGQRWLLLAGLGDRGVVALIALALGRPRRLAARLERLGAPGRPGAAAAGAASRWRSRSRRCRPSWSPTSAPSTSGLSSQSLGPWLWDVARSAAIAAVFDRGRRGPADRAGAPLPARAGGCRAAAASPALAAVFVWLAPVVLAPIFNRFEPLPAGSRARAEVLALGERAGVEIGEVYRVDASRRVTSLNAYVGGLGPTKRVVLYDNLLAEAERAELRSVVAHELGHVAHHDIPRGIAYIAIVAPLGLLFTRELGTAARRGAPAPIRPRPAALPAYLLALSLAALVLGVPGNQLSREVEASADDFALELTGDPRALIDLQLRLARTNLSDPDPPGLFDRCCSGPTRRRSSGSARR